MSESHAWNEFNEFCQKAIFFGTSPATALILNGLGTRQASIESQSSTFSLLYVKMVSIFSDEIIQYCNKNKIDTSDNRLKTLLDKLKEKQITKLDFTQLHGIRSKRNDISHKISFLISKDEFFRDKEIIDFELLKLY